MNKPLDTLMLAPVPIPGLASRSQPIARFTNALVTIQAFNPTFDLQGALRAASYRIGDVGRRWPRVIGDPDYGISMCRPCMNALTGRAEVNTAVDTIIDSLAEAHP